MSEEVEKLYNGLTYIDDDLILEAGEPARSDHWKAHQARNFAGKAGSKFKTVFVRVAVACLVLMISMATVLAASPALREMVEEMVVGFSGTGIQVSIVRDDDGTSADSEEEKALPAVTLGWLPEGGTLTVDESDPAVRILNVAYADGASVEVCVGDFWVSTLVGGTTEIEGIDEDDIEAAISEENGGAENSGANNRDEEGDIESSEVNNGDEEGDAESLGVDNGDKGRDVESTEVNSGDKDGTAEKNEAEEGAEGENNEEDTRTSEGFIQIQDHEAVISVWKDQILIFWYEDEYDVMVSVHTQGIDEKDAKKIAEEMVIE
ncbi:MAG: MSCRAMM family adhesin SdrC [Lachnospiraceae bacterium]|nr:MSCRAMM family adhesin SdrC [Lachnospiraceae bacterium]